MIYDLERYKYYKGDRLRGLVALVSATPVQKKEARLVLCPIDGSLIIDEFHLVQIVERDLKLTEEQKF